RAGGHGRRSPGSPRALVRASRAPNGRGHGPRDAALAPELDERAHASGGSAGRARPGRRYSAGRALEGQLRDPSSAAAVGGGGPARGIRREAPAEGGGGEGRPSDEKG